jgi:hypothetical protein
MPEACAPACTHAGAFHVFQSRLTTMRCGPRFFSLCDDFRRIAEQRRQKVHVAITGLSAHVRAAMRRCAHAQGVTIF